MSASMTPHGLPTPRSWPTNARRAPSPSSAVPFACHGVSVEGVMTDNGNCYRSHLFRQACNDAGIRHLRTKPYTPRTNGKAERFIQTVLRECAAARPFHSSPERADALPRWTHAYNVHPPHTALTGKPPISRLDQNNLLAAILSKL